jgi:uncharacterized protein (DUF1501 family)
MNPRSPVTRRRFLGEASCAAVSAVPVLNTLLNLSLAGRIAAAGGPEDYRALVCVFLAGGNDSFNMLVPREPSAYAQYAAARADLALPPAELIDIQPTGLPPFAVHHRMPELASLFETGKASFLANVGTLIEPVSNRAQVEANLKRLPLGLYSHSDQIEQWQTSVPQSRNGIGWAGRMADLIKELNADQTVSMNISLDGSNVWQTGNTIAEYAVTPDGAVPLYPYQTRYQFTEDPNIRFWHLMSAAVDSQVGLQYTNLLQQTFQSKKKTALDAYKLFAEATAATTLPGGVTFPATFLGSRLRMVALTIAARAALGAKRQTFFLQWGGWDHHNEVLDNQFNMLRQVSEAVGAFQQQLEALGVADRVVTFSASDFGRTLTSNGRGSDHAWGSNQFILGGGVRGRRLFGQFPSLAVNPDEGPEVNPLDTGRGRFIPTTSCDAFFAELALWLGVSKSNLPLVLPNLGNFYDITSSAPPIGFLI